MSERKRKRTRSLSKEPLVDHVEGRHLSEKRPCILRIDIPVSLNTGLEDINGDSEDLHSLFSVSTDADSLLLDFDEEIAFNRDIPNTENDNTLALRICPPISGLYFDPSLVIPQELADQVFAFCMKTYFLSPLDNQVMLFGRFLAPSNTPAQSSSGFPQILHDLLDTISCLLQPNLPPETYCMLFPKVPTMARQAIVNLYQPGEGITPHVDLLGRYGDGIIGVSLSSGSTMRFDKTASEDANRPRWDLYLPRNTVIVLSKDARYNWTHGIDGKKTDFVSTKTPSSSPSWIERGVRMSVTFRWLLPGADILGDSGSS